MNALSASEPVSRSKRLAARAATVSHAFLFLAVASAPHSIAVAQSGVTLFIVAWGVELWARGARLHLPPAFTRLFPGVGALSVFFILSLISGILSYEPRISLDGMRSVFFMTAPFFAAGRIRSMRQAVALALTLIFSAQATVVYTAYQKAVGVGFRITELSADSPLRECLREGDVVLMIDGRRAHGPDEFAVAARRAGAASVSITARRVESAISCAVVRTALTEAGVKAAPARDFRATGFFNHYTTYAEVLQILISLTLGMWFAARPGSWPRRILPVCVAGMALAMWTTLTRAPLIGLGASVVVILGAAWRRGRIRTGTALLTLAAGAAVGVAAVGYAYATRKMGVGDVQEGSLFWRLVVWQEGMRLVEMHPAFGIGRNSDKIHGAEWRLYAQGDLPPGHFHNSYLQIAVWYGVPALLTYAWLLSDYFGALTRVGFRDPAKFDEWSEMGRGAAIGSLGALTGFAVSSLVHFNLGDGEVAITLWLVLGVALAVRRFLLDERHTHG